MLMHQGDELSGRCARLGEEHLSRHNVTNQLTLHLSSVKVLMLLSECEAKFRRLDSKT
jgi:hypothetical protein